jgi:hypothetical protein
MNRTPNHVLKTLHFLTVGRGESEPSVITKDTHVGGAHL